MIRLKSFSIYTLFDYVITILISRIDYNNIKNVSLFSNKNIYSHAVIIDSYTKTYAYERTNNTIVLLKMKERYQLEHPQS